MYLTEAHLIRVINDSYADGIDFASIADAYSANAGDALANFIVIESAESSEGEDGFDPALAAAAMREAERELGRVADAFERMATAEVASDDGF